MKTCVIMQPTYLPWLGYFDLINTADVFVFLDHVQFSKQSWQQRNKIRDRNGEQLLVVPVKKGVLKEYRIKDVLIDSNKNFLVKHLKTIKNNYAKAKNFGEIFPELEEIYSKKFDSLVDLNIELIRYGCEKMGLEKEMIRSSALNLVGNKVDGLISICKLVGADHYHSPLGSKDYIDERNVFEKNSIQLSYQKYSHPEYQQITYDDFISNLAFVDYLFNR
jgi:hypothetical protein